jgi:signal transduction histidine kinase
VRQSARRALINRAKDISNTVGVVMRSQRRFGSFISRERLESALSSLINPGELSAIALLNDAGEVVASAGAPIELDQRGLPLDSPYWAARTVTLMNLVDLGTNLTAEVEAASPTIVVARSNLFAQFGTNRPPGRPGPPRPPEAARDDSARSAPGATNVAERSEPDFRPRPRPGPRPDGEGRPRFTRPFWMSEEEYKKAIQKQGVHSFILVLSTELMQAAGQQDLWLRGLICALGAVAAGGLMLAWRNVARSSDLEVRLVRAAELNTHLKEMNLAAAGLAHETKNPLNIIRGLAQVVSKQEDIAPEIRQKSRGIIEEADRVTAKLNEFIDFSRPREVRRSAVTLGAVVGEVVRALNFDLEEKAVNLRVADNLPRVEADEHLLRQALFNLLLNAIQAVEPQGQIEVVAVNVEGVLALEIRDNGPGVQPEHRANIFKPYFTTSQKGTGLGLAVVQQIVVAHGWEIQCLPNEPRGAVFRISHLRLAASA